MSKKTPSGEMSVGRGRFRQALLLVLLDRHTPDDPELRARVISELGDECIYGGLGGANVLIQLDHLWPKSVGGRSLIGNLVPSCPTCNSDRRQQAWEVFLRTSVRALSTRTQSQREDVIRKVKEYMARHDQGQAPNLEEILTEEERTLRIEFDLLLQAISDGALAVAGHQKSKSIVFDEPTQLFQDLLAVVRHHHRSSSGACA